MSHNNLGTATSLHPVDHHPDDDVLGTSASSWLPVDLTPYLRGEVKRAEPSVGATRSDGLPLLYPGKEHSVIGEMEAGKSWFCLACVAAELSKGNHVVYVHFEEADPLDTVERLRALGVADVDMLERFRFVGPDQKVTAADWRLLLDPAPGLVVLDGVNEGMVLHGMGIREEDGAALFRSRLVKPCTAIGAAVLSADHVVKDRERRDRGPLGSIHKGNGLTGSLIVLENAEPFGRGQRGCSHVFVTKDRPGSLRQHGRATRTPGKTFMGSLIVDDTRSWVDALDILFAEPRDDSDCDTDDPQAELDHYVYRVVEELEVAGVTATMRAVYAKSCYGKDKTGNAIERLLIDGKVTEDRSGRSRVFATAAPGERDRSAFRVLKDPGTPEQSHDRSRNGPGTVGERSESDGTVTCLDCQKPRIVNPNTRLCADCTGQEGQTA